MFAPPKIDPPMITIVGGAGAGKTTLAALFPAPVFVQAEGSQSVFETWDDDARPKFMPPLEAATKKNKLSVKEQVIDQLRWLATQEHDRQTVVIDTVTSLNAMFEDELCIEHGVAAISDACGGYNKGFQATAMMHRDVQIAGQKLRKIKNMAVVFLAHTGLQKVKNRPDTDDYTTYGIDMPALSVPVYTNLMDAVFYVVKEAFVKGAETNKRGQTTKFGKLIQTGDRKIITTSDGIIGYTLAKSRYPIEPEIPLPHDGTNPLLSFIPFYNQGAKK